jgi:predicted metal-dependent phosphoesterase TrpH
MEQFVDLHVHTTISDGTLTPTEVVELAAEKGLRAITISDHDTTAGVKEAQLAGKKYHVQIIPGIEVSTYIEGVGSMHMVGLGLDLDNKRLQQALDELVQGREVRNTNILRKLRELGYEVEEERVRELAGGAVVGRLHIATAMMEKNYVASLHEAFDCYLGSGKPAYMHRRRFTPEESIAMIREAGGVAVMAHPFSLRLDRDQLERHIRNMAEIGLGGIEILYPEHTAEFREYLFKIAEKYHLAPSGGSDFHGANKPGIELGSQRVPVSFLKALHIAYEQEAKKLV